MRRAVVIFLGLVVALGSVALAGCGSERTTEPVTIKAMSNRLPRGDQAPGKR